MQEKFVLTVCTASYLGQAKGMADSVILHNPGYKVVIGLADKLDLKFDRSLFQPHRLVEVHELNIPEFKEMAERYNILELSCALKTFFVGWLLQHESAGSVIYLDADILVFNSFGHAEELLSENSFLITPHITSPFPDQHLRPMEKDILKTGMFNAGFFAVTNDKAGNTIIDWWKSRMTDQAFERPKEGLNIDQNWLNFVPLYFKDAALLEHPGYNVAYWNLHERQITKQGEQFFANDEPLVFFHYSGYVMSSPKEISKHQDRTTMNGNKALEELFSKYHTTLEMNNHQGMLETPFYYKKKKRLW